MGEAHLVLESDSQVLPASIPSPLPACPFPHSPFIQPPPCAGEGP